MKKNITQPLYTLPYSLHDMYLTEMERKEDVLIFHFPGGIVNTAPPCIQTEAAQVIFTGIDWDSSFVYIFDSLGNCGVSTAEKMELTAFLPILERLEIIDETYGYWQAKWSGLLMRGEKLIECMVEICYSGEMIYEISE